MKHYISNLWKWKCGLPEQELNTEKLDIQNLYQSERDNKFETLMRNRLVMGAFRYGLLDRQTNTDYDRISSMIKRLNLYKETGNLEYLVDVANLAMVEFKLSTHSNKHFKSIDDGDHAQNKS